MPSDGVLAQLIISTQGRHLLMRPHQGTVNLPAKYQHRKTFQLTVELDIDRLKFE